MAMFLDGLVRRAAAADGLNADFCKRHVLVTVGLPRQEERAAAILQRFESQGWTVRPLEHRGCGGHADHHSRYQLEVSLSGAKRSAVTEAERRVRATALTHGTIDITESTLVTPAIPTGHTSTWHMYRRPPWDGVGRVRASLARTWVALGGADVHRAVTLDGPGSEEEATTAFRRSNGSGVMFEEDVHAARPGLGPTVNASTQPSTAWYEGVAARMLAALCVMLYGGILHAVPTLWQLLLVLPLAALAWRVGRWIAPNQAHPAAVQWGVGAVCVGGSTLAGFMYVKLELRPGPGPLAATLLLAAAWFVLRGTWYALRRSWLSRNAVALLSVAVLPLPWVLPAAGRFMQTLYLDAQFGIPVAVTASIDPLWTSFLALRPVAVCGAVLLVCVALAGWARYWYWNGVGDRTYSLTMVACIGVMGLATVFSAALSDVSDAASHAATAAASGRTPKSYFGIAGELVCVTPVVDKPSVFNGPIPTDHPLLSFGVSGAEAWFWDPRRGTVRDGAAPALHLPAEQVTTVLAREGTRPCPGQKS